MLTGAVLSRSSWSDTLTGANAARAQGVHSLWLLDDRDPFVALAALAAEVPGVGVGFRIGTVLDRPPLWLAKQLTTLALLVPAGLHLLVDEVDEVADRFDEGVAAVQDALGRDDMQPRPPALDWWYTQGTPLAVVSDGFTAISPDAELVISELRL